MKRIFPKQARKLNVSDIEDYIGSYYSDKEEEQVRKAIKDQYKKRLALRHPILTGIPTLGLAPTISREQAIEEIVRKELRRSHKRRKLYRGKLQEARKKDIENYRLSTERAKAEAIPRAVIGGVGAWQLLKPREQESSYSQSDPYGSQSSHYRSIG